MAFMAKGCWFWIDCRIPEDERTMSVLCDECRKEKYPDVGSYWDFDDGCGPWDIICDECKKVLHKHVSQEERIEQAVDEAFSEFFGEDDEKR